MYSARIQDIDAHLLRKGERERGEEASTARSPGHISRGVGGELQHAALFDMAGAALIHSYGRHRSSPAGSV